MGKVVEYPFDTVKVRLQSQPDHLPLRYTGPLDCFKKSFYNHGALGFYRGVSAPFFGAAVETSSLFFSYRLCQDIVRNVMHINKEAPLPLGSLIACGATSGAFTSFLLCPIELVKCQIQAPQGIHTGPRAGPLSVVASVYRHHGLSGFWHGQFGTLIRETGGSAAWFGSYEYVSSLFRHYQAPSLSKTEVVPLSMWQQMAAGASAGVCYNFAFYPADTIKSRMQTEELAPMQNGKRQTFGGVAKAIWRQQGLQGLYRGCGITVARSAPSSALIFTIYESLRSFFG